MDSEPLQILLVEDDAGHVELIRRAFRNATARVEIRVAGSLQDFRAAAAALPPAVAIMDLNLPDGRAIDALQAPPEEGLFPVVVMTSYGDELVAVEAMRAGAMDYIVKSPAAFAALPHNVERVIREWALLRAHHQATAELRDSAIFLHALLNAIPVPVYYQDTTGLYLGSNRAFESFFGKSQHEIVGRTVADIVPRELAAVHQAKDVELLRSAGTQVFDAQLEDAAGLMHDVVFHKAALTDSSGRVTGLIGAVLDITERKHAVAAREKLEAQLHQSQKMEAVGRLAGGVAHDFNNMLQTILGNADLALEDVTTDGPLRESLLEIEAAAKRSAELTMQLLAFARKQVIAPKVLDLNAAVTFMLKMLRRLIGENIELLWRPGVELWPVEMDPGQLNQILANLAVNARDAITGSGTLTVETGNAEFDDSYCRSHADVTPGAYVMLALRDTGCGMDKAVLDRIFEPFFTTKGLGKGTGLGLAMVYGIVKQNHGFIQVSSEPGQGTQFRIYLPRLLSSEKAVDPSATPRPDAPPIGTETVLLVEDEPAPLRSCRRILEGLGYTVLGAEGPREALRLSGSYAGEIHLLLTDVVMPGMSGRALHDQLTATRPSLKCLYMSGYTADIIAPHGVLEPGVHFLQKPFSRVTVATKLREVLDS